MELTLKTERFVDELLGNASDQIDKAGFCMKEIRNGMSQAEVASLIDQSRQHVAIAREYRELAALVEGK